MFFSDNYSHKLHYIYLTLCNYKTGPNYRQRIAHIYHDFQCQKFSDLHIQKIMPASFRRWLLSPQPSPYALKSPYENKSLSPQWQHLLASIDNVHNLSNCQQTNLIHLLLSLGFVTYSAQLSNKLPLQDNLELQLLTAHAELIIAWEGGLYRPRCLKKLHLLAHAKNYSIKIRAQMTLLAYYSRQAANKHHCQLWGQKLTANLKACNLKIPEFKKYYFKSRLKRAISLYLWGQRKPQEAWQALESCCQYAQKLTDLAHTQKEKEIAIDNLLAAYQSSAKALTVMHQPQQAHDLLAQKLTLDPYDGASHYELAEHYYQHKKLDQAIRCYSQAILLGPPFAHLSWFRCGQIAERQKKYETAYKAYSKVIQIDPDSISGACGLKRTKQYL